MNKYWAWVEQPTYDYHEIIAENEAEAKTKLLNQLGQNCYIHRILDTDPNDHNGEL